MAKNTNLFWIGGKHSVLSAINNPKRKISKIYATENFLISHPNLKDKATIHDNKKLNNLFSETQISHQGIAAQVSDLEIHGLKATNNKEELKKVIILDNITDQRNIGSIFRTALAFNVNAIIIDKRIFNQRNQLMIKSAAGAIENLKIFTTSNIVNEIRILKKNGLWIYGLDLSAKKEIEDIKFEGKFGLIFGSESKGIKNIVKNNCDELIKININPKIDSLNVSNSVAAVLSIINLNN